MKPADTLNRVRQSGVTLIEMLVALALLGLLLLIIMMAMAQVNGESKVFGGRLNARLESFMMTEQIRRTLWYTGTKGRSITSIESGRGFRLRIYETGGTPDHTVSFQTVCRKTPAKLAEIKTFGKVDGLCRAFRCANGQRPMVVYRRKDKSGFSKTFVYPRGDDATHGSSRDAPVAAAVCFQSRTVGASLHEVEAWTAFRDRGGNAVRWERQGVTLPAKPTISGNVNYLWPGK